MLGGIHKQSRKLYATVESYNGFQWSTETVAPMPLPVFSHCAVGLNDTHLLIAGGSTHLPKEDNQSRATFFYNILENKWTAGPSLNSARTSHSCALLTQPNKKRVVIVAGGEASSSTVEMLFLDSKGKADTEWHVGPNLPLDASNTAMVATKNSVIIVIGKSLFQLEAPGGTWHKLPQQLEKERSAFTALLIPDRLIKCNED